jgi:hypothetical protein
LSSTRRILRADTGRLLSEGDVKGRKFCKGAAKASWALRDGNSVRRDCGVLAAIASRTATAIALSFVSGKSARVFQEVPVANLATPTIGKKLAKFRGDWLGEAAWAIMGPAECLRNAS